MLRFGSAERLCIWGVDWCGIIFFIRELSWFLMLVCVEGVEKVFYSKLVLLIA